MLTNMPENPVLGDVFKRFPKGIEPLLAYHDVILRGPSPLTAAERELIAAFVSGLNACGFCYGAHTAIAEALGIDENVFTVLMDEGIDNAPIDEKFKPVLRYVEILTKSPSSIRPSDSQAVRDAGWNDEAIHDAAVVCALFNFMNRLIEGTGITTNADIQAEQKNRQSSGADVSNTPYMDYGRSLGLVD